MNSKIQELLSNKMPQDLLSSKKELLRAIHHLLSEDLGSDSWPWPKLPWITPQWFTEDNYYLLSELDRDFDYIVAEADLSRLGYFYNHPETQNFRDYIAKSWRRVTLTLPCALNGLTVWSEGEEMTFFSEKQDMFYARNFTENRLPLSHDRACSKILSNLLKMNHRLLKRTTSPNDLIYY